MIDKAAFGPPFFWVRPAGRTYLEVEVLYPPDLWASVIGLAAAGYFGTRQVLNVATLEVLRQIG